MILATDVQYADPAENVLGDGESAAIAAGVLFTHWQSEHSYRHLVRPIHTVAPYEPGAFYKRELPCLLTLLADINIELEAIIVDGYVSLGQHQKPGLGMHLYDALSQAVPVIGVAKNKFAHTPEFCEVLRGRSQKPLFVTAVGMPLETAKLSVESMHGDNRIPTVLKKVDQLCRGII
ncbi:MAG: endonuclease V [Leptolyngbyaceae cyanobacterium MAG.088]|nr:endonuclease V [Leptolyngbyaceae cyanobacterium MAG.088]